MPEWLEEWIWGGALQTQAWPLWAQALLVVGLVVGFFALMIMHGFTLRNAEDPNSFKVRRAKVGGYVEDFSPEEVAELDELVAKHLSPFFGFGDRGAVGPLVRHD